MFNTWLHIHTLNGQLYVFTDDGHWINSKSCGWNKSTEITFEQLAEECWLGSVEDGDYQFRIRLKPSVHYTKFGCTYEEPVK
jgi:hypothetical protein